MPSKTDERPHVVIVGAGFGGLTAAKALHRAPVRVTLLDRTNHHTFQPLLYQVAMAGLATTEIAQPIRAILHRERNVTVLMADAVRVDLADKIVRLAEGDRVPWDFLILACGAETSYFGHDEWASAAPGLKSLGDAINIREQVLLSFERAERETDAAARKRLLSFVVIGGGPTGVELAGALAELAHFVLGRDFRRIDPSEATVHLLEGGPRLLPSFSPDLSDRAVRQLQQLGVEVRTGTSVTGIEHGAVLLGTDRLECAVALWAAGVRAADLTRSLGVPLDKAGRVFVNPDLTVPGHLDAFVIGDAARLDGKDGHPLPGVSPVAMQEARAVARQIRQRILGKPTRPFEYFDKGSMATIGRSRAVVMLGKLHMSGFVAWIAWLFVHIFYLIGFKNRIVVMFTWAWSYFTYRRGSRIITHYAGERPRTETSAARARPNAAQSA